MDLEDIEVLIEGAIRGLNSSILDEVAEAIQLLQTLTADDTLAPEVEGALLQKLQAQSKGSTEILLIKALEKTKNHKTQLALRKILTSKYQEYQKSPPIDATFLVALCQAFEATSAPVQYSKAIVEILKGTKDPSVSLAGAKALYAMSKLKS